MDFKLILNTVRYLNFKQIFFQVFYRIVKPQLYLVNKYVHHCIEITKSNWKYTSFNNNIFVFLNISSKFSSWNDTSNGNLWAYNLNYMDWLNQDGMTFGEGAYWVDKFISDITYNKIGLDPYPIALRGINWIKFISRHWDMIPPDSLRKWNNSLYSQYRLLTRKLEYHLLGNHLLEDAYSLYIAAVYFTDNNFYYKSSKLLRKELKEQILPDGAHYEQSPMYHCILLDRLLDCYNISSNNIRFDTQVEMNSFLKEKAILMLSHLESIVYKDKTIPLLNDSANKIAPTPVQLFEYAQRLGLAWNRRPLKECGYRFLRTQSIEAVIDVGNITATYQPGHTHSDIFNYEVRISGIPFIVDTGISTYNKTSRRQYERSTAAHNTIVIDDDDYYQVWGGFRVGNRVKADIIFESSKEVRAQFKFHKSVVARHFTIDENSFSIEDEVNARVDKCYSFIHLAPHIKIISVDNKCIITSLATIRLYNVDSVQLLDEYVSVEYNALEPTKTIILMPVMNTEQSVKMKYQIMSKDK